MSDELLNRHAEEKYWEIYFKAVDELQKPVAFPCQFLATFPYRKIVPTINVGSFWVVEIQARRGIS